MGVETKGTGTMLLGDTPSRASYPDPMSPGSGPAGLSSMVEDPRRRQCSVRDHLSG
jgi:hypothetical protein